MTQYWFDGNSIVTQNRLYMCMNPTYIFLFSTNHNEIIQTVQRIMRWRKRVTLIALSIGKFSVAKNILWNIKNRRDS